MAFSYTPSQQQVIDARGCNILVSAAAGSGKTAVLVERIIQIICDENNPVDIDRLLIVTFTNAAAAEMRERISAAIAKKLLDNPGSEHLERQSALIHNAQITTVDSFCLYLLRNHFNEIGLDPAFRIADEGELKLLAGEVMEELMEERFGEKDPAFVEAVEFFCYGTNEKALEGYVQELYGHAQSNPWPMDWLMERKKDYDVNSVEQLLETDFAVYLTKHLQKLIQDMVREYDRLRRICEEPDGPYMYGELLEAEAEKLTALLSCSDLAAYETKWETVTFDRLPSKKDDSVNVDKREYVKTRRNKLKDRFKDMKEKYFNVSVQACVSHMQKSKVAVDALIDLAIEYSERLSAKKREKKLVDFSDMEHMALQILLRKEDETYVPSPVAMEYREHFYEVMCDEYQDSNLVQESLLWAVSGETAGRFNRFMVGDVKQSIYKFRLARPQLFLDKYEAYENDGDDCRRIDLNQNFRSRQEVTDSVNSVFERLMSKDNGGIVYDDAAALHVGANYPENTGCKSELMLTEEKCEDSKLTAKELEAKMVAHRIKELLRDFKVTDKATGGLREATYKDIVILFRAASGYEDIFKRILEEENIPVYISSRTGYFAAIEVQEVLSFLRVLDNPMQDIPLFGVMKSVFGGFTEEEIALIRSGDRDKRLWSCLQEMQESAKISAFVEMIKRYRDMTVYLSVRELLENLVKEFDYLHYVAAMPMGAKRRANVEMLLSKASAFEQTSYHGVFHFVRYIEKLEKFDVDMGTAELSDENANVVRIMSIHKSKGLEFPITFVCGMAKGFNMRDTANSLLMDMDYGVASDYVNHKERYKHKSLRRMALACKMREENLAEELRILYVALTRPKEKLIMTGTKKDVAAYMESLASHTPRELSFYEFMDAKSYLDFVLPVLDRDVIDVREVTAGEMLATTITEGTKLYEKREMLENAAGQTDEELLEVLEERFSYVYPHSHLENLHTKTSVSELKIAAMQEKDEAAFEMFEHPAKEEYIPSFIQEKEETITGAVRGNAFHRVMELIDYPALYASIFDALPENAEVFTKHVKEKNMALKVRLEEMLDAQVQSGRLTEQYRDAVSMRKLLSFFTDTIGYRMWRASAAGLLFREQPFVYGIAANRLNPEFSSEEKVLIQGIIDAFFEEDGKVILLDYKTDRVETPEQLMDRYKAQLDYYTEAIEHIYGKKVEEKILYSFSLEMCVV